MRIGVTHPRSVELTLRDAVAVAEQFEAEDNAVPGKRLALDLAGDIIAASKDVRELLNSVSADFAVVSRSRPGAHLPQLQSLAEESLEKALINPSWRGSAVLGPPFAERSETFIVKPVTGPAGLAGWILSSDEVSEVFPDGSRAKSRITALAGDSVLLLEPSEVRFAESDRHFVWLTTDHGRFRAATKGMDNVERELSHHGFLRVHRSFLINPDRIRRIRHKGNGLIALCTDYGQVESIPVARRYTREVRKIFGI
jgi:sigma-54 dependent transcriptional regulator, acetoin dehydrogenase operon transcriptional activator AcoR